MLIKSVNKIELNWNEEKETSYSIASYSQLSPCGHPAITDTQIERIAPKSPAKTNYKRLTEINSPYYGLPLKRTVTRGPYRVRYKGTWL